MKYLYNIFAIIFCLIFMTGCTIGGIEQSHCSEVISNIDSYDSVEDSVTVEENSVVSEYYNTSEENSTEISIEENSTEMSIESSQSEESEDYMEKEVKLIVNGVDISEESFVEMGTGGTRLPFVAIMKELGAEFVWENERVAKMYFQKMTFVLDVDKHSLVTEGRDINLFIVCGGGILPSISMDRELVLDSARAGVFFRKVGITMEHDYDNRIMTINSSLNPPPPIIYLP